MPILIMLFFYRTYFIKLALTYTLKKKYNIIEMNYLSMKGKISFVLISAFLMTNASFATTNYSYESEFQTKIDKPLKSNIISVPAGSAVSVLATSELSSESLTHGQVVQMALGSNFYFNNQYKCLCIWQNRCKGHAASIS